MGFIWVKHVLARGAFQGRAAQEQGPESKPGRPRKSSPAIGKSVSPVAVRTQAGAAAVAWASTATLWRDQPWTTAGEITSFAARRVLLLVILHTMELPAMKGVLQ